MTESMAGAAGGGSRLSADELRELVAAAGAAPSLHNTQPWQFRPAPDGPGVLVFADPARAVPLADPDGRAMLVSVGAALFNLRVAAARQGLPVDELEVLPGPPGAGAPVAVVHFGARGVPYELSELAEAIGQRHSSREPFGNRDVPEAVVGELIAAAAAEDTVLEFLEEAGARRVLALTAEAEARIAGDAARRAETGGWLREEPAADGIPDRALGPQDHEARVPVRDFAGHGPAHSERFEALPQLVTIATRGDTAADWLRAGQAMERVWLVATAVGLRVSVLHQAVELSDTRWRLRDPDSGVGTVQVVLRVGYGPPGAATPRRGVEELLGGAGS
ncbi:Acg family FMN-binding oxidoreductase [Streptomyces sp. TLI_171]|uniref:Acg family FMN-binding oxidoreductase n=1 Tax=Streptomyces sp. TLI_171 TaxID=1938859 RepID=UPI000C35A697|nr:nitroreductase family protein [Streptomyces sp. TLI_171]RKE22936.1 nitroreductase family protein [Streptomyces sp. TLI_171]